LALHLASAMRLDALFASRANNIAVQVHKMNKSTSDRVTCGATAFKTEEFTEWAPQVLEKLFKPEELKEALDFYRSKTGQRWVDMTFDVFHAEDTGAERTVKLSRQELAEVQKFMSTPLGDRIANMAKITSAPEAKPPMFSSYVFEGMKRCPKPAD
jgi:hypothetical protein